MSRHTHVDTDDLQPEYDFSGGLRGKHHLAYRDGTNVVFLEPDLAEVFPDSASVNHALRLLVRLARSQARVSERPTKTGPPTSGTPRNARSKVRSRAVRD